MISYQTGNFLEGANWLTRTATHGIVGGGLGQLQGQSFQNGFIAAATAQALSGQISKIGNLNGSFGQKILTTAQRGMAAGLVGGTTAAISGGEFENGAWTAAYAQMFNDTLHDEVDEAADALDEFGDETMCVEGFGEILG